MVRRRRSTSLAARAIDQHMTIDRRDFVLGSLAAATTAACGSRERADSNAPSPQRAPRPSTPAGKSILILGGTNFLGPHVVAAARARGHRLTLFNRGKTHPGLFPDLEQLHGDRDGHLEALAGRTWDAVVDTSGYVPRVVKQSAELLAPRVHHYVFISTISVYQDIGAQIGADEAGPLDTIDDPTSEDVGKHYGALKALCERTVETALPARVAVLRPGLIVGPGDPTGRFTHWPWRMSQGGEVLAPGDGTTPAQWIDGRDLGAWIIHLIEQGTMGTFNALGPSPGQPFREVLEACNEAAGRKATLTWVDAKFLAQQKVEGWSDLPMWIDNQGENAAFGTRANARAVAAGLTQRAILETAKDTLAWLETLPDDQRTKVRSTGIAADREAAVLAAWRAR
jgi:2'-hydroxyisoflavone reductase